MTRLSDMSDRDLARDVDAQYAREWEELEAERERDLMVSDGPCLYPRKPGACKTCERRATCEEYAAHVEDRWDARRRGE